MYVLILVFVPKMLGELLHVNGWKLYDMGQHILNVFQKGNVYRHAEEFSEMQTIT